jgi:hypothetical protein
MDDEEATEEEQIFHNTVRENIVSRKTRRNFHSLTTLLLWVLPKTCQTMHSTMWRGCSIYVGFFFGAEKA